MVAAFIHGFPAYGVVGENRCGAVLGRPLIGLVRRRKFRRVPHWNESENPSLTSRETTGEMYKATVVGYTPNVIIILNCEWKSSTSGLNGTVSV